MRVRSDEVSRRRDQQMALSGTAYFLRCLNELPDADLQTPSVVPGWTRAMIIADVGYRARALTRLLDGLTSDHPEPEYPNQQYRFAEVQYGASLAPRALRHLVNHSAVQLRVAMRDLPESAWDREVRDVAGARFSASVIPFLRAQNVWLRAVQLDNGSSVSDLPLELRHRQSVDSPIDTVRFPGTS
jgi:maleylpyruvate isomerase